MKKKIILSLVILCMVLSLMPATVRAAEDTTSGIAGIQVTWQFENGTLTISGSGEMTNYSFNSTPWQSYQDEITCVVVEEGITSIGKTAFYKCKNLTDVLLPSTLETIEMDAFKNCDKLTYIVIPENVTYLGDDSFYASGDKEMIFLGDSPLIDFENLTGISNLNGVTGVVYYPADNSSWENSEMFEYWPDITWKALCAEHSYGAESKVEASCTSKGYTLSTCTTCGCSQRTAYTDTLGHDMEITEEEATCTGWGSVKNVCKICGEGTVENIAPLGHTYTYEVTKVPTDTENGVAVRTCGTCKATAEEDIPTLDVLVENQTITKEPTCKEEGIAHYLYSCQYGDVEFDIALNPTHTYAYQMTLTPTEKATGTITGVCTDCKAENPVSIPALNKTDYSYQIITEPTEEKDGVGRYTLKNEYGVFTIDVAVSAQSLSDLLPITETNFPDAVFRAYVAEKFDKNTDGSLSEEELAGGKYFHLQNKGITSLKGIEHFTELVQLFASGNSFQSLEIVSSDPSLFVDCDDCTKLEKITLNGRENYVPEGSFKNTALKVVIFESNYEKMGPISCPKFSGCTQLYHVTFVRNPGNYTTNGFKDVEAVVYYPENINEFWLQDWGGKLTWRLNAPDGHIHDFAVSGNTYTCACGEVYQRGAAWVNPFEDVSEDKFYYEPVLWAYYGGVTTGKDATHFNPSGNCTRSQVVTFLWRAAGEPEPESLNNPFPDVPEGKFYTKAVLWAVEQGITAGYKDGTFGPNDACTRGQIVTFLWRYFGEPEPQSMDNPFPDVAESKFYYKAVLWAVENEITGGFKDGTFGPNKTCTRDQIVTFLYRAMA